jgi:hypothetical protein
MRGHARFRSEYDSESYIDVHNGLTYKEVILMKCLPWLREGDRKCRRLSIFQVLCLTNMSYMS